MKELIVSVGKAKLFTDYLYDNFREFYDILHIGSDKVEYEFIDISHITGGHEVYEEKFEELLKKDVIDKSGMSVTCVLTTDDESGIALVLLEYLRDNFDIVKVQYIARGNSLVNYVDVFIERLNLGVISNMTMGRNVAIDNLYVSSLDSNIGGAYGEKEQIRNLANTFHKINVLEHNPPDYLRSNMFAMEEKDRVRSTKLSRISTYSEEKWFDKKKNKKSYFPLDMISKVHYYKSMGSEEDFIAEVEKAEEILKTAPKETQYIFSLYNMEREFEITVLSTNLVIEPAERQNKK